MGTLHEHQDWGGTEGNGALQESGDLRGKWGGLQEDRGNGDTAGAWGHCRVIGHCRG